MSDTGSGSSGSGTSHPGQGCYQNGVWLSKAEGARNEKYQKWIDERTRSKVEHLDKQKHCTMVKLHSERLQVRTELRGLQQHRRHHSQRDRQGSSGDDPGDSVPTMTPPTSQRRLQQKVPSSSSSGGLASPGSSAASSSSSSSPSTSSSSMATTTSSSSSSHARRGGSGREEVKGAEGGVRGKGVAVKGVVVTPPAKALILHPNESDMKFRNIHSSRTLSKLKHNMDISN